MAAECSKFNLQCMTHLLKHYYQRTSNDLLVVFTFASTSKYDKHQNEYFKRKLSLKDHRNPNPKEKNIGII